MLRAADSMIVQLVLATGSNAGIAAPIHRGYYMVGRHPACQIRPKTRSVSRRHLLIHYDQAVLAVIDLGSASGTRINDEKIEPKRWYPISDGDVLRLGKTVFNVSIQTAIAPPRPAILEEGAQKSTLVKQSQAVEATSGRMDAQPTPPSAQTQRSRIANKSNTAAAPAAPLHSVAAAADSAINQSTRAPAKAPASFIRGEAWEEFDVASFLHSADEVDRENRYESIRQSDAMRRAEEAEEDDAGLFEDTPIESDEGTLTDISSRLESEKAEASTASVAAKEATIVSATMSATATRAAARGAEPTAANKSRFSSAVSLGNLADTDRAKAFLAVIITIGILGYTGYAGYQFTQGPPAKIIDDID
jgi:pSer/pThr/pTyr-binding forkhead associated (FHA) protein